ncbi:related to chloroperoxidase [Phialocephala subalpina]|uniref:Related to chloroperoxidase n=1 Tax=Phialocephala subalpina TaxID=576137 RepID=A0A1L7WJP9_9HELO|nr:related to chloroperoxidase [Phialocephala subalpina]
MHSLLTLTTLLGTTSALSGMLSNTNLPRSSTSKKILPGPRLVSREEISSPILTKRDNTTYPPFLGPRPGDVRSPCPGLNALANHDICPRNGKGYTIPLLTDCLKRGMNMGADFSLFVGAAGIGSSPNFLSLEFDLDQLDHHDMVIEHDASLSRADASTGNNYSFNQTIWDTVLAYYDGTTETSIPVAAKAKYNRVQTESKRDPTFTYGPVQFIFSYGETAIYLSTMGDPTTGVAPIEYVRSLFEEERLPYEEGWRPTAEPTTLGSLAAMIFELNIANGEELPEGLTLTESTLKAVLRGLDPITGKVLDPVLQVVGGLLGITSSS